MTSTSKKLQDWFLRESEVIAFTGVSKTTLWRWEAAGTFPKRIPLGSRSVGWRNSQVMAWMECRVNGQEWSNETV